MATDSKDMNSLATALMQGMQRQMALYEQILPVSDAALSLMEKGEIADAELDQINSLMGQVREIDATLAPIRESVPVGTSAELDTCRERMTLLVQQLFEKTKQLESKIQSARDGMLPAINQQVAATKMHKAYAKNHS